MSETMTHRIQDAPLKLIAARIRRARREADLSLDRLGEAVGSSRHHLIRLEKGIHRPRLEMLTRIAEATGRQVEWFLDPELEPSPFQEAA
jgi:transcriptional regulator with XRE-family HTH domain